MKKLLKYIAINFLIFIIILAISEYLCRKVYIGKYGKVMNLQSKLSDDPKIYHKLYYPVQYYDYKTVISETNGKIYKGHSNKRPVITIGCSYTAGSGMTDESQSFAYKLNKYTNRTTYNRGVVGTGPQLVYRQLSDKNFKNEIPDAEYIIYTFIYNHVDRLSPRVYGFLTNNVNLNYKLVNNKLIEEKHPFAFLYFLYSMKNYMEYVSIKEQINERNADYPLFYKIMEMSVEAMKNNYPNSKFVFIEFPEAFMCHDDYIKGSRELTIEQIKKLENLDITYINAEELVGHDFRDVKKYRLVDEDHPNEKVWDEIVPALSKRLNL